MKNQQTHVVIENVPVQKAFSKFDRPHEVGIIFDEKNPESESLTQQHFKDELDINNIVAKYNKTGVISAVARTREIYGDFTEYQDVVENFDKIARAEQMFEQLPATIRNEFNNSPQKLLAALGDEKQRDKLIEFGVLDAPIPAPAADPVLTELQNLNRSLSKSSRKKLEEE